MRRRREMQWAARINNALEEGRFEIFRQMILPLQRNEPGMHYELLLRMRDEQGKIIAPDQFIAAAERYNITPAIDRWVIENALRWLVRADEREKLAMCSINCPQSLSDDKFLPFVIDQFHRSGIVDQDLFEITETAAVASFSQANRFIQALKELGCRLRWTISAPAVVIRISQALSVDFLKIDGSFVKELLHDPIDREMVRSSTRSVISPASRPLPSSPKSGNHRHAAQPRCGLRTGLWCLDAAAGAPDTGRRTSAIQGIMMPAAGSEPGWR
jgi:EAL domain-containing protein (putative c-di-GMP-specific phosphodiesterase class I)